MRVLLISSRFPLPPHRGNQVRSLEWLQALQADEVALSAPVGGDPQQLAGLHRLGVSTFLYPRSVGGTVPSVAAAMLRLRPVQEGLYGIPAARAALRRALADRAWDVAVVQMVRCAWAAELLQRESPGLPILFDAIDAMGQHYRRSAGGFPLPLRPAVHLEAATCRSRERWLSRRAAITTAVSQRDLDALDCPPGRGLVVPVAAKEIDASPAEHGDRGDHGNGTTLLLSGNLGYRPTVNGASTFAAEVWPRLRRAVPGVRWVLAGARPTRAVRRLAELPGVEVHADVDDLGAYLRAATMAIAPMDTGSGVPMKVLEAWAAGLPVVAAPWAAAGLQGDGAGLHVAATAQEWLVACTRLLTDRTEAERLARQGQAVWQRWYRPDQVAERVRVAVRAAAE